ncbi:hypothetical protein G6F45_013978 [Rhizopus arrhizus]|nr:hypothetical protein G6F45_013978 [Rhizopus arrhizus]
MLEQQLQGLRTRARQQQVHTLALQQGLHGYQVLRHVIDDQQVDRGLRLRRVRWQQGQHGVGAGVLQGGGRHHRCFGLLGALQPGTAARSAHRGNTFAAVAAGTGQQQCQYLRTEHGSR